VSVHYEVRLEADGRLADRLESYMRSRHIPDILSTRCFSSIHFDRAGEGRFRAVYVARSRDDLERYIAEFAPALRADFLAEFPSGVRVTREVWDVVGRWSAEIP
jgi:hypothetical protein